MLKGIFTLTANERSVSAAIRRSVARCATRFVSENVASGITDFLGDQGVPDAGTGLMPFAVIALLNGLRTAYGRVPANLPTA